MPVMAGSLHDWLKRRERALPVGGMVKVGKDKVGKDKVGKDKVGKDNVKVKVKVDKGNVTDIVPD